MSEKPRPDVKVSFHAMLMAELQMLGGSGPGSGGNSGDESERESQGGQHHLYYDGRKGWMLRVTVDLGRSVVGKRLKFRLKTRDAGEAEKARDLVLATLKRLGLTVKLRMQERQRREEEVSGS